MSGWLQLREELSIHKSAPTADGSPAWTLHDPSRNLYFRIDWLTFEVLARWGMADPNAICNAIEAETTLVPDLEELESIHRFLLENELFQRHSEQDTKWYLAHKARHKTSLWSWLLHRYLFFRVPLWRPDAWLEFSQGAVRLFYTRTFFFLTLCVLGLGLFEAVRQWDTFRATLVDTFTLQGLVAFFVTLIFVKFFHELGHAYTAKRLGCRVPTMGIAFLVLFPMAYTDVNEVWKLRQRRHRLYVGVAGVTTEFLIAIWALLAWALLPDGYLRTGAFLLATTTWVSTVLINASPFLRFDGYFLLMDWLDMPNLHQRAFALGRWRLRELLFRLGEPIPEYLTERRRRGLIIFAVCTWLYRLIVFVGIALLVYWLVPKPLGPFLAAVELTWFIGRPIWSEFREWGKRMPAIVRSRRTYFVILLLCCLVFLLAFPWDRRVVTQGVLQPSNFTLLYAPASSKISEILVQHGETVTKEQRLTVFYNPDLQIRQAQINSQLNTLLLQIQRAGVDQRLLKQIQVMLSDKARIEAELISLEAEANNYIIQAPFDGTYFVLESDLQMGNWVPVNTAFGMVADTRKWQVETYLTEQDINRISPNEPARFYFETPTSRSIPMQVVRIDNDATRNLQNKLLIMGRGGSIPVRNSQSGDLVPDYAIYRVVLEVLDDQQHLFQRIERGRVVIHSQPKSYLERYWKKALGVIIREANF